MLGVGKQYNTIVVSARGHLLQKATELESDLRTAALDISTRVKMRFPVERRATLDFREL